MPTRTQWTVGGLVHLAGYPQIMRVALAAPVRPAYVASWATHRYEHSDWSGWRAIPVTVEAHVDVGLPALVLSGLPDASLNEARDRVRAAIVNSDEKWPERRITSISSPPNYPSAGPASTSP